MKRLLLTLLLEATVFLGLGTTAFSQNGIMSPAQEREYRKHFAIKVSLGIRDDKLVHPEKPIAYPLAFRVRNSGNPVIKAEEIPGIFFQGILHVLSADGKEQQAEVQPNWRTMVYDLQPGKVFESPDYANLLDFFPGLKDGEYQVWWTRRKLKSNVLRFTVTKEKLRLHHSET